MLNIYNPLNNIKFTKEKKSEKITQYLISLKESIIQKKNKKKKKKINHFAVTTLNTISYLKYL